MPLTGEAKTAYQREYMRRRRARGEPQQPPASVRRREADSDLLAMLGAIRDVGVVSKALVALPRMDIELVKATLAGMESREMWLRRLNLYREETEKGILILRKWLDAFPDKRK